MNDSLEHNTPDSFARAWRTPLPLDSQANTPDFLTRQLPIESENSSLNPPRASYIQDGAGRAPSTLGSTNSGALLAPGGKVEPNDYSEEQSHPTKSRRKPLIIFLICFAVIAVLVLVIVPPVYFKVVKPKQLHTSNTGGSSNPSPTTSAGGTGSPPPPVTHAVVSGGDGSTITAGDGTTFVYNNQFGGIWYSDPNDPFSNNAYPNSWTPPLNQSWTWGKDRVFGVNLGGLFVLEPYISPALFQKYPNAVDEWTLSELMTADQSPGGGLSQLEDHYNTFITEQDIAEIAGAGLNWVRVPIPYWAVDKWPNEPFLAKTSWKYILRLLDWCRKYGLRVNLDLHTIPGSQNAYNHSGKLGIVNFLNGVMGIANAQRALEYIRVITEFISQPQYTDLVPMFSIMNEPLLDTIGQPAMSSFYLEVHDMIRGITGFGEGKGPYIAIHDGFSTSKWADFLPGSDRMVLDTHPYFAFSGSSATSPIDTGTGPGAGGIWPAQACSDWGGIINGSRVQFGVTIAGEFSNGFNDCGLFLKGTQDASVSYGGDCSVWQDSSNWSDGTKAGIQLFSMASMDALVDFFFWTWKVGKSSSGIVESPLWSYQLGLQNGWMPKDPRTALGVCQSLGEAGPAFDGTFQPWQTGGAGAGTIAPTATSQFPWPPAEISGVDVLADELPVYTPTGTIETLPPETFTASATKSIDAGNGWFNAQDTVGAPTPIPGCSYPDGWNAVGVAVPSLCGASVVGRAVDAVRTPEVASATITPAPLRV